MVIRLPRRILGCLLLWLAAGPAHAVAYSEDAVKAAFLHRFSAYVQWPVTASQAPFVIAVVGADDVAAQLERLLPGLLIQERPAQVRKVDERADLDGVFVLYIGSGSLRRTHNLVARASSRPILIVTEEADGMALGGVINFLTLEHHVRFEISLAAAERSGLKINSGLLSVAARVLDRPHAEKNPG